MNRRCVRYGWRTHVRRPTPKSAEAQQTELICPTQWEASQHRRFSFGSLLSADRNLLHRRSRELFSEVGSYAGSEEFDRPQHLLMR